MMDSVLRRQKHHSNSLKPCTIFFFTDSSINRPLPSLSRPNHSTNDGNKSDCPCRGPRSRPAGGPGPALVPTRICQGTSVLYDITYDLKSSLTVCQIICDVVWLWYHSHVISRFLWYHRFCDMLYSMIVYHIVLVCDFDTVTIFYIIKYVILNYAISCIHIS
jgi:hypothetical protein